MGSERNWLPFSSRRSSAFLNDRNSLDIFYKSRCWISILTDVHEAVVVRLHNVGVAVEVRPGRSDGQETHDLPYNGLIRLPHAGDPDKVGAGVIPARADDEPDRAAVGFNPAKFGPC